ncbi:MAG: MgtC/SapB family protein, partial [Pseudomonadota bacterium]
SLLGYAALRIGGDRYGTLLTGFFGGSVSSTATTLAFARHSRENPELTGIAGLIILIANLVVLLRLSIVIAVVMPGLWLSLTGIFLGGALLGSLFVYLLWRRQEEHPAPPILEIANPAEIRSALGFGALYALILFAAAWLSDVVGQQGIYAVALISGLSDVDAITLSSLRLYQLGNLQAEQATVAILIALLANIAFKCVLASSISGLALARRIIPGMAAVALGLVSAWWLI